MPIPAQTIARFGGFASFAPGYPNSTLAPTLQLWNNHGMGQDDQRKSSNRFDEAIRRFDEANSRDPNRELVDGVPQPRELIYARWLTDWVLKLSPDASEPLRLAAR